MFILQSSVPMYSENRRQIAYGNSVGYTYRAMSGEGFEERHDGLFDSKATAVEDNYRSMERAGQTATVVDAQLFCLLVSRCVRFLKIGSNNDG